MFWGGMLGSVIPRPRHRQHSIVQYSTVQHSTVTMGKWRLVKLLMCSAKYQRLTTEDYIRLGLCPPDQEASTDSGHYVKNDKMVS